MRLALGQLNATIGDFAGNAAKIEALWKEAEAAKAGAPVIALYVCSDGSSPILP